MAKLFWIDKKSVLPIGKKDLRYGDPIPEKKLDKKRIEKFKASGKIGTLLEEAPKDDDRVKTLESDLNVIANELKVTKKALEVATSDLAKANETVKQLENTTEAELLEKNKGLETDNEKLVKDLEAANAKITKLEKKKK